MEDSKQLEPTQREKDKAFISWCIDMYLDGKVPAEAIVSAISTMVKPNMVKSPIEEETKEV